MNLLRDILLASWNLFAEASPYVLFGFFAAGLLKALLPAQTLARHLGRRSLGSVTKASLLGIPLPLCSCGVIPAAVGLRRQGATKGASAAFLVSVPETGIDSIAITWALLDPVMTAVRPLAAFITATVTGVLIDRLPEGAGDGDSSRQSVCGCGEASAFPDRPALSQRLREGLAYAFGDLLRDIGKWLLLGIVVAGTITALVPESFFVRHFDNELLSLLLMLGIGIPMYICASASTPVAAALVLKGLSPGAALVFLLAGPATNTATLAVVGRYWGRAATAVYLASIGLCSLLLGWLTNRFYAWSGIDIGRWIAHAAKEGLSSLDFASAIALALLLALTFIPKRAGGDGQPGGG